MKGDQVEGEIMSFTIPSFRFSVHQFKAQHVGRADFRHLLVARCTKVGGRRENDRSPSGQLQEDPTMLRNWTSLAVICALFQAGTVEPVFGLFDLGDIIDPNLLIGPPRPSFCLERPLSTATS